MRPLLRRPGFVATAAISIALGIGVNTTIFSVANGLLLRTPAIPRPHALVRLYVNHHSPFRYDDYRALRERTDVFTHVIAEEMRAVSYRDQEDTRRATLGVVSGDYFRALGLRPARGTFVHRQSDDTPAAVPAIVLSHAFWTRHYGADPAVIGRTARLNEQAFVIAGVAPQGFTSAQVLWAPDAWMPMSETFTLLGRGPEIWSGGLYLTARLRPGVSPEEAEAAVRLLLAQRAAREPAAYANLTWRVGPARGINPEIGDAVRLGAVFLQTVAALVLLVACSNVGNLFLARNAARRRELALRMALGAGRGRIMRLLLGECALLAVLGAAVALFATRWSAGLLAGLMPDDSGLALTTTADARVLGVAIALVVATVLLAGLAPALQSARADVTAGLRIGMTEGGARASRLRRGFLMVQVAVSTVLLGCAGLFGRSLQRTQRLDVGFPTADLVDVRVEPGVERGGAESRALLERLEERLRAVPGVAAVTAASVAPLTGESQERSLFREGDAPPARDDGPTVWFATVGPAYFATMGIPLVAGRDVARRDGTGAPLVAVVNEALARRLWPSRSPLGERIGFEGPGGPWHEVVGVARTIPYGSLGEEPRPFAYVPYAQVPSTRSMVVHLRVRDGVPPAALAGPVATIVRELDPTAPPPSVRTLAAEQRVMLLPARLGAALTGVFGALALLLAGVGLFGVAAVAVALRTREIGIRSALGAKPGAIIGAVLGDTLRTVAVGAAVGVALALAAARLIASRVTGVEAMDPVTFLGTPLVLAAAAAIAAFVPARRATRVDPVVALRSDG
jgi:predicted permease